MKTYLITGAGGFIGGHLVASLINSGNKIVATDLKPLAHWFQVHNGAYNIPDLDLRTNLDPLPLEVDCIINLACDHGGVGYLTNNDFRALMDISINTNLLKFALHNKISDYMFASSACVYNSKLQEDSSQDVYLKESDAWPALPDMKYGLEKLYSEELCLQAQKLHGIRVYLPRIHGCYGPYNHFNEIREKAPNALLRKTVMANQSVEVWGTGDQRRSFMYVDDAVTGIIKLLSSSCHVPINLGSDVTVTIHEVAKIAQQVVGKNLAIIPVDGTVGVNSRSSDNTFIVDQLDWKPSITIEQGFQKMLPWIQDQVSKL